MITIENIPPRIAKLPRDHRGFPVPWFASWVDGKPDFRVVEPQRIVDAYRHSKCWICGEKLGKFLAFVIGPMCAINRTTSEPPSHRECGEFAARVCPFLVRPKMRRNEKDLPTDDTPGIMLRRNPGVALLWITRSFRPFRVDNGVLFTIGDPIETVWFAEGRQATRAEVLESINSGLPFLIDLAKQEGGDAPAVLEKQTESALRLIPGEAS